MDKSRGDIIAEGTFYVNPQIGFVVIRFGVMPVHLEHGAER
jgi:hypothetical protein